MVSTLAGIAIRCNAGNPANVVVRVVRHEFSSNDTVCRALQDANAVEEIVATFAGIRMFVMIHPLKTLSFSAERFDSFSKVPAGCADAYKAATGWKDFASISEL